MKYPKIQTLYDRDKENNYKVIPSQLRRPEFGLVKEWLITEKIDGRNHRVMMWADGHVEHRGRTDRAEFTDFMVDGCERLVNEDKLREVINQNDDGTYPMTVLYGELYGPKIQGGGKYRDTIDLRIFDVRIGDWWLGWDDVVGVALALNLDVVPVLRAIKWLPESVEELGLLFRSSWTSYLGDTKPEGIVARTDPLLFDRRRERVMWKLKLKDFER